MPGRRRSQFSYAILRVVPRIERGECFNAGVVLYFQEREFLAVRTFLDERRLAALAPKAWLHARLSVQEPDAQGFGLAGSGVFVLNPPHTLNATLAATMPYLVDVLGRYSGANFLIDRVDA